MKQDDRKIGERWHHLDLKHDMNMFSWQLEWSLFAFIAIMLWCVLCCIGRRRSQSCSIVIGTFIFYICSRIIFIWHRMIIAKAWLLIISSWYGNLFEMFNKFVKRAKTKRTAKSGQYQSACAMDTAQKRLPFVGRFHRHYSLFSKKNLIELQKFQNALYMSR